MVNTENLAEDKELTKVKQLEYLGFMINSKGTCSIWFKVG